MNDDSERKLGILLKEYDTLRAEVLQRINNRFMLMGLIGGLITFAAAQTTTLLSGTVAVFAIVLLMVVWWRLGFLVARCSMRIIEIEDSVNKLVGEKLLEWEGRSTKGGWLQRLYGIHGRTPIREKEVTAQTITLPSSQPDGKNLESVANPVNANETKVALLPGKPAGPAARKKGGRRGRRAGGSSAQLIRAKKAHS